MHARTDAPFDAVSDRFDAAWRALDATREEHARRVGTAVRQRQAYERANTTADRRARRGRELFEHLAPETE